MTQSQIVILTIILCLAFWSWDVISLTNQAFNKSNQYAVARVIDGDGAILINRNNKRIEIRLAEIDAPEFNQEHGSESKKVLEKLIKNKIINVRFTGKESYGRLISKVYVNRKDINLLMVKKGAAWVEPRFSNDEEYYKAQNIARKKRLGLWYKQSPMPPWVWRSIFKNRSSH
jgi:endonuclease YncB( thermonuclease family)